ncbi:FixH family protein [Chryseomicrobium sp. FSL W7-1435]|uniref:FixH family protein n=1 Tax=Chryseomicrobium sp. FSL W7-1435 TaxID=2921704 RepID=UPI00315AC2B2
MKQWIVAATAVLLLAGCTSNTNEDHEGMNHNDPSLEVVEVEVLTAKELEPGETVMLSARVTQEEEAVNDAEEVKFEVWESGLREEGTMLEGELTEDGVYEAEYEFANEGVYYMFAHTTARGMHVMPKTEIIVGTPDMSKVLEDNSSDKMNHNDH